MGKHRSKQQRKRVRDTDASSPTTSKRRRHKKLVELQSEQRESESPLLPPSSDSLKKINVPSASGANSNPSASSASVNGNNYCVFLSFRGPDTRKGFVDHLYHALVRVGLHQPNFVFRDDENLHLGEPIANNLISAIKHSKISIPVISENYAASEWCLRELIQIMECVERGEQKVLPVLYKVKRKHVRKLEGAFGTAFKSKMHLFEEEVKQQGPLALRKAVDRKVLESEKFADGCEGKLVKGLVRIITLEQEHDFSSPPPVDLVGIDDRVAEVMELADTSSSETQTIVIHGIGGIGKTTLATNIFRRLVDKFEYCSFLENIRETIRGKDMGHVQSLLISDITKSRVKVRDTETGIANIQRSCKEKKVLILLDDVDCQDHLDNLIGGCNFESGSRIIITSRDKSLLKPEYKSYELKEMNSTDSMLLFSRHAFAREQPPTEFTTLASDIVDTTGGLPLALKVIGSLLKGVKDEGVWRDMLKKLKNASREEVQKVLRISYDTLEDDEKHMFLDIACFFVGTDIRIATYLWDDLVISPRLGLKVLINHSLINVNDKNELMMHDQLRDLGRAIACPQQLDYKRLWDEKARTVLQLEEKIEKIEALRLDKRGSREFMKRKSFKRMARLKFLHVSDVKFDGDFKNSLSQLRWLKWERSLNSFKATNVHLKKLLILDLSYGYISRKWRGWSSIKMKRLKVLNLSHCTYLVTTPNLSAFKSLEILILEYCDNLKKIDPSIGDAKCLTSLNLSYCHKLKKLPSRLGELKCLVSLNLSSCWTLEELPKEMGGWEELKELTIDGVRIKEIPPSIDSLTKLEILSAQAFISLVGLPDSISHLVNLSTLDLRWCMHFKELPESIGSLVKLQRLLLGNMALPSEADDGGYNWNPSDIYCLDRIPPSIGKLKSLTHLYLTCTKISKLPKSIGKLETLKILNIAGCKELSSLPTTISKLSKLEELDATACESLEGRVSINGLSSLKILRLGKLGHTADLFEMHEMDILSLETFGYLSSQRHLDLINCNLPASLTILEVTCCNCELPQLSHLTNLKELSLQFCEFLESIPVLPSKILNFWVIFCDKLKRLPNLSSLECLSELWIIGCSELKKIKGLEGLKSLRRLSICGCKKLPNLNGLVHLQSLRELEIRELDASLLNDRLFRDKCLGRLKNLEMLHIISCQSLERLDVSQLTHLRELVVFECKDVVKIEGLEGLKKLRYLNIRGCNSIRKLPDLSLFDNLGQLDIQGCSNLHDVQGLEKVKLVFR